MKELSRRTLLSAGIWALCGLFLLAGGRPAQASLEDDVAYLEDECNISFVHVIDEDGTTASIYDLLDLEFAIKAILRYPESILEYRGTICPLTLYYYSGTGTKIVEEKCGCSGYAQEEVIHISNAFPVSLTTMHEVAHQFYHSMMEDEEYTDAPGNPLGGLMQEYLDIFTVPEEYDWVNYGNHEEQDPDEVPDGYSRWYALVNHEENFAVHVDTYASTSFSFLGVPSPNRLMEDALVQLEEGSSLLYDKYVFIRDNVFFGEEFGTVPIEFGVDPPEYEIYVPWSQPVTVKRGEPKLVALSARLLSSGTDTPFPFEVVGENVPDGIAVEKCSFELSGIDDIHTMFLAVSVDCDVDPGIYTIGLRGTTWLEFLDEKSSATCELSIEVPEHAFSIGGPGPIEILPGDFLLTAITFNKAVGGCSYPVTVFVDDTDVPEDLEYDFPYTSFYFNPSVTSQSSSLSMLPAWDMTPGDYAIEFLAYDASASFQTPIHEYTLPITVLPQYTLSVAGKNLVTHEITLELQNQAVNAGSYAVFLSCSARNKRVDATFDPKNYVILGGGKDSATVTMHYSFPGTGYPSRGKGKPLPAPPGSLKVTAVARNHWNWPDQKIIVPLTLPAYNSNPDMYPGANAGKTGKNELKKSDNNFSRNDIPKDIPREVPEGWKDPMPPKGGHDPFPGKFRGQRDPFKR